jgi:hypothetical protein
LLFQSWNDALLFRMLATLRLDATVFEAVDQLRWTGPRAGFEAQCQMMKSPELLERAVAATRLNTVAQSAPAP